MNLSYETKTKLNDMLWAKYYELSQSKKIWSLNRIEWKEYLLSLGCVLGVEGNGWRHMAPPPNKINGTVVLHDPADGTHGVAVPDEVVTKVLVLGGFPTRSRRWRRYSPPFRWISGENLVGKWTLGTP